MNPCVPAFSVCTNTLAPNGDALEPSRYQNLFQFYSCQHSAPVSKVMSSVSFHFRSCFQESSPLFSWVATFRLGMDSCLPFVCQMLVRTLSFPTLASTGLPESLFSREEKKLDIEASRGTKEMELGFAITEFTDLGFGLAVGEPLSSEDASCLLFDTALCTVCFRHESKKWLQENIDKSMMFNKWRKWSHPSRLKLSLVRTSENWFLVSTYLIWILGYMSILSNKQPTATLRVPDTNLIVGRLPLIIILMTAKLPAKTYNRDSHWECAFAITWSNCENCWTPRCPFGLTSDGLPEHSSVWYLCPDAYLIGVCVLFGERNTFITTSHKPRASKPSIRNPASNEITSDSVQLWETDVCFLLIQLIGTHVRLPKKTKYLGSWFWVLKDTDKVWVLTQTRPTMLCCISYVTTLTVVSCVMNVWNESCQLSVTSLCWFVDWSRKFVRWP